MSTDIGRTPSYTSSEVSAGIRTHDRLTGAHPCGVCLDFGYLPDVGPCPRCHPDEYAEYILVWARDVHEAESASGDAA